MDESRGQNIIHLFPQNSVVQEEEALINPHGQLAVKPFSEIQDWPDNRWSTKQGHALSLHNA